MVIYRIPVWLRIVLIWATFLLMGGEAFGQTLYKTDSASNVWSKMVGTLGSGIAAPVQIRVLTGDGAKFAKVGVPLLIKISTWGRASGYQDTSHYELDSVSAISGDTLTISKRKLSNSYQLGWNAGSRIEVAFDFPLISQLQKKIAAAAVLPTLDSGKVLSNNGTSTLWITQSAGGVSSFNTRTGAVVPVNGDYSFTQITGTLGVTRGGTGLTSIASGEMLYASATNTLAQLTPNTGLSISGGNLNVSLGSFTTDNLAQGSTNKYYKDSLARASLSATAPVLYNATTGVISESQASTVSNGWLSAADYITLMAKQNALTLPLSIANGGTGQITRAAALKALLPDTTSKTGYFLKVDSTGDILWRPISVGTVGSSGTVTSVALSVPAWLSVSGSPITTSGTLAISAANEDSAKVLIGPASGSAAAPTFRLLAATDIPNLSAAQITSGVLPVANGGSGQSSYTNGQLLIGNTSGNTLTKATLTGTSNEITVTNGTGSITLSTPQAIGTGSSPTFSALTLTNPLTEANGGTAQNGYTAGDVLYASATNTLSKLGIGSSGQFLQVNTGLPSWQTTLGAANGGTGRTTLTANDLLIGNGTSAVTLLAPGGANTVLTGSTGPSFQTLATGSTLAGNGIGTPFDIDLTHANTWTGTPTVNKANIQTTYTDGLMLENTTASDVSHTVQQSPSIEYICHVWNTTATAMDSIEAWREQVIPVSGTTTTSSLTWDNGNTAGGFTNVGSLSDAGALNVKTGGSYKINGTSVLNATTLGSGVTASSLTSVGTIATGVWNGTTIAVNHGGTGLTTLTSHAIQIGNGTGSPTQLGLGTSTTLLHGAAAGDPTWSAVSLTAEVSGVLPVANGGTDTAALGTNGILIGEGANGINTMLGGKAGRIAISNGAGLDPSMQVSSIGWTGSVDTSGWINNSGAGVGTLQWSNANAAAGITTPILATIQLDANSDVAGVNYILNLDSTISGTGLSARSGNITFDLQRESTANVGSTKGASIGYFIPTSFTNGVGYSTSILYANHGTAVSHFDTTITDTHVGASSYVFYTAERNANSAAGIIYWPYLLSQSASTLNFQLNRKTTSNVGATEGCRVNWAVLSSTPDGKIVCGSVAATNTCGADTSAAMDTITSPYALPTSTILLSCLKDGNSQTNNSFAYYACVEPIANWPAGKFIIRLSGYTTSGGGLQKVTQGHGCTVNYAIINPGSGNPSGFTAPQNWTFPSPISIASTSNQLIFGTGTTTTLNFTAPAASATYTVPDVGTTAKFAMSVNGIKIPDTASSGGKFLAAGTGGGAPTWSTVTGSGITGVRGGVFGGSTTGLTGGLIYYANPNGNSTAGTSVAVGGEIPVSGNFTLQRLHVKSNAAAGAAQSTGVTLFVNGVGTPIIATISGASATTASDDIDTFNVSADDLVTVQINPTATSGATGIAWSFEMVAR